MLVRGLTSWHQHGKGTRLYRTCTLYAFIIITIIGRELGSVTLWRKTLFCLSFLQRGKVKVTVTVGIFG